jgi:hypothetical protein
MNGIIGGSGRVGLHSLEAAPTRTQGRLTATDIDRILGRELSATPLHLSRVLYIPQHTSSVLHLPLYDISDSYRKTIGDIPIGSSLFTIRMSQVMKKPCGDGTDLAEVQYLVDFEAAHTSEEEKMSAKVQRRVLGNAASEVDLLVSLNDELGSGFRSLSNDGTGSCPLGQKRASPSNKRQPTPSKRISP